jgi:hypothetical protein
MMPDETTGEHPARSLEDRSRGIGPVVSDDDIDFYDDAAAETLKQPEQSANPWREPQPADQQRQQPEPEKPATQPEPERAAAQPEPQKPAEQRPAAVEEQPKPEPEPEPAKQQPEPKQPAAAADHDTTIESPLGAPFYVPESELQAHRTTRLFDDVDEQRTVGIHLPGAIDTDLGPKERPAWRPPLLVWVITGLFVSIAAMCTFLYPAFTGYDETFHVDMTYSYYNGNGFYAPGGRMLSIGVQTAQGNVIPPPTIPFTQQQHPARGDRKSFDASGGDAAGTYKIPNQMVQHPPLYYAIGAGFLHLIPGSHNLPFDQTIAILRYLSILMIAPLPYLAWAAAKTLIGDGPAAVTAAVLPLTLPNLTRIAGNWNNDNLLTILTAALIFVLCKVIAGDLRKRTGFWAGLICALACLTKGYALVLPVLILLVYAVAWIRHRRRPWAPFGVAALVIAVLSGWWWIRNIVLYGAIQPEGFGGKGSYGYDTFYMTAKHAPAGTYTIHQFIPAYLVRVLWRTWGGIGYPEHPLFARTADWVWFGIVAAGAIFAICFGIRGRFGRIATALFVLPTIMILAIPMVNAVHHYLYNGILPGAQGRYLYPSVTAVGILVGVGYSRLIGRKLAAWLPLVVVIGALGTQALAWRQLVKVWWVPTTAHGKSEEFKDAFRGILKWSPWSHPVTTGPFIAVVAFSLLLIIGAVGYGIAHRAGDDEPLVTDGGPKTDPLPMSSIRASTVS